MIYTAVARIPANFHILSKVKEMAFRPGPLRAVRSPRDRYTHSIGDPAGREEISSADQREARAEPVYTPRSGFYHGDYAFSD